MFTDTTYFDIFYDEPCDPVNQLPTASGGITGTFVSGGITYKYHTWSTFGSVLTGSTDSGCSSGGQGIFVVENMGNICSAQLLIVGGGGSGGTEFGGGGGGGQVVYVPNFPLRTQTYCCTRGNGGTQLNSNSNSGSNGQDSTFRLTFYPYKKEQLQTGDFPFTITARGGGGGGSGNNFSGAGGSKGTGGGMAGNAATSSTAGVALFDTSIYYNGSDGGSGTLDNPFPDPDPIAAGGGGGGAAISGSNASSGQGGNGGAGFGPLYMTGSTGEYYGGGGGGGGGGMSGSPSTMKVTVAVSCAP